MDQTTEFEKELIASVLLDPELTAKIREICCPTDFQDKICAWILKTIFEQADKGEPIDPRIIISLVSEKSSKNRSRAVDFITSVIENAVTSGSGLYYAKKVKEEALKRKLRQVLENGANPEAIITFGQALAELQNPAPGTKQIIESQELLSTKFEKEEAVINGGVLPKNGNAVMAGESGWGKSLLTEELGIHFVMG